jgi:hypothetical protein
VSRGRDRFGKQPLFGHCDIRNKKATTINVPMSAPVIPMTFHFVAKAVIPSIKHRLSIFQSVF